MIPARGYVAVYLSEDSKQKHTKPVIAWDDEGAPLVAGDRKLVRADFWINFHGIAEDDNPPLMVVPGGGWMITYSGGDQHRTEPVVAWAIDDFGYGKPLATDGGGLVMPEEGDICVWHPDASDRQPE